MDLQPFLDVIYFVGGLVAIMIGGQFLVRGAAGLAQLLDVSPLFIGLLIVSFGASAPELFVTLNAALKGEPDLAMGNVVGSNIANILLILGLSAIIAPITIRRSMVFRDAVMMLVATGVLVLMTQNNEVSNAFITRFNGIILFGTMIIFILLVFVFEQVNDWETGNRIREEVTRPRRPAPTFPLEAGLIGLGFVLLHFGSGYMVDGAAGFARRLGVTEAVIGLSVLALATSLPELVTAITAATRRQYDILVGSVLGSSMLNILLVLGLTALVQPISINARIAQLDMWIMLAAAVILIPFMMTNWRLSRSEGALLVGGYGVYLIALYSGFGLR